MGRFWIITMLAAGLAMAAVAAPAHAQVAAPSIAPGTFTSDNPAAVKWGTPSRFGVAGVGMQREELDGSTTDYIGAAAGFRGVGENFALGVQLVHLSDQSDRLDDTRDWGGASLALQTGSALAWGLGYSFQKQVTDFAEFDAKEQTVGLSIRLGEVWFIGAALGREEISSDAKDSLVISYHGQRETSRWGLGFRRGGTVLIHAEVFGAHKDPLDTNVSGLGEFDGEDITGGTLEFTFWSFLIGGSMTQSVHKQSPLDTVDVTTADVGWAPRQGLAVTLHYESTRTKVKAFSPGSDRITEDLAALVFTWQL